jgi:hypothetical protein
MGVVYLALDTTLDREIAIKALPEALADFMWRPPSRATSRNEQGHIPVADHLPER